MANRIKSVIFALIAASAWTLFAASGVLGTLDYSASDAFYQTRSAAEEDITVIGIDDRAIEEIGPYNQWRRDVIAQAIEALNETEEKRPAAIAVDVLYVGETDPGTDEWLAEAAGEYGNVITASLAHFEDAFVEGEDGELYRDRFAIIEYEEPFGALKDVTTQGHINAMLDSDGVLRHHLLEIELNGGEVIPSMALAAARLYNSYHGRDAINIPPADENGFWYLPFTGEPGDFYNNISVADLLSGDFDPEEFAGKVVFIGPYTVGLQDHFFTAADHAEAMYGVEYQANAVHAMLFGQPKREVKDAPQLAILFIILFFSFLGFWKKRMRFSTIVWLGVSAGWLLLCKIAYLNGYVLHVLWVPFGATVLFVGSIAYNYISSAIEKHKITSTFKRYVAPEIVNEILKEGPHALELGGKNADIAVLFVDIRGFTTMSEQLAPKEVVEILNRYLTLIADCILNNGGTLDKFVGDAAMAFWGAPIPQEDYVMHAVKAASDMAKGAGALSKELTERFGRAVSFGIGIHVGEAVVGNIGSPERMDYTAIGDTVNTAARLEANAPAGTIYISREVADRLEGRIKTTSLGTSIKLKGKAEGFEVLIMEEIL